jgi:hypothetical protein
MTKEIGVVLIVMGLVIAGIGLVFVFFPSLRIGRLPGDIMIQTKNGRFYLPIVTCLALSLILTLLLWLLSVLRK